MSNSRLFKLFQASAGSGKTHTLVLEYLKTVFLEPQKIGNVLAITFTNKAAYEMKERILRALKKGVLGKKDPIIDDLKRFYPQIDISLKAKEILTYIIHNYTKFSIMTIDSFIHKIVNSYAFELDIPPHSNVVIEENIFLKKTLSFMFEKLDSSKDVAITKIFKKMVENKLDSDKSWDIEIDLRKLIDELVKEDGRKIVESIQHVDLSHLYLILDKKEMAIITPLKNSIDSFIDILKINSINPDDLGKREDFIPFFVKTLQNTLSKHRYNDLKALDTTKEMSWRKKTASNKDEKQMFEIFDKLKESNLIDLWEKIEKNYNTLLMILKTSDILREVVDKLSLLKEFYNILEEYKKANSAIPISDFNYIVKKIVTTESIPFIFQKIGETYHNYLIDEFQDTSKIQWENIFPLIENSMSERYHSLAVGDVKQAIYRWRGGDSHIMANLKDSIETIIPNSVESFTLQKNFRSSSNIIKFNNELFSFIKKEYLKEYNIYEDVKQEIVKYNEVGYIEIDLFVLPIGENSSYNNDAIVDKIVTEIKRLNSLGVPLKNIATLARTNKDLSTIASALLENGVQAISSESVLLRDEEVVAFIVNILYFLQDKDNIYAQFGILSFFAKHLDNSESVNSFLERYSKKISKNSSTLDSNIDINNDFLDEKSPLKKNLLSEFIPQFSDEIIKELKYLPLYDTIEFLIRIFELNSSLKSWSGFLEQLLNEIVKSEAKTISDFLFYWEESSESIYLELPADIDAVQIMTIHKSKGLEFDYVFIPFANWDTKIDPKTAIWTTDSAIYKIFPEFKDIDRLLFYKDKDSENSFFSDAGKDEEWQVFIDNLNLLYVAFTRAKNSLYITVTQTDKDSKSEKNERVSKYILQFIQHIKKNREGFFKEDNDVFSTKYYIGKKIETTQKNSIDKADFKSNLRSYYWQNRVNLMESANRLWIRKENEPNLTLFRELLINLDTFDDDNPFLLKQWLFKGIINDHQELLFSNKIEECKNYKVLSNWYQNAVSIRKNYKLVKNGKIYQCDRLVEFEDYIDAIMFINSFYIDKDVKKELFYFCQILSEIREDTQINGYIVKIPSLNTPDAITTIY